MNTLNPQLFLGTLLSNVLAALLLALPMALVGPVAWAQQDPPGRVGRVASVQGQVFGFDGAADVWSQAEVNLPLTSGDRISTGATGRAELQVGSTTLRLHSATELEVLRLDDTRMVFELKRGSMALRVRSSDMAEELEVFTAEASLQPLRAGHYRIDRTDRRGSNLTLASSWRGDLRVADEFGFTISTGQQAELRRDGAQLRHSWVNPATDLFAERVLREEEADERREGSRLAGLNYVSPEMTGAAELDRHGRWDRHPDWGPVWFPLQVSVGWAPYKLGRWTWVHPWGWTWVDNAPWGFAPFHYGRWVQWNGRWGWAPGNDATRPIYSPGLVVWSGRARHGGRDGPGVSWAPLPPRQAYVPAYRQPRHPEAVYPDTRADERKDWRMRGQPERRVESHRDGPGAQQQPGVVGAPPVPLIPRYPEPQADGRGQRGERGDRVDSSADLRRDHRMNNRMGSREDERIGDGPRGDGPRSDRGEDRRLDRRRDVPAPVQAETPQAPPAAAPRRPDPPPRAAERQGQPEPQSPKRQDRPVKEQEP